MAQPQAFATLPVTAAEIIRQVGHKTYSRGQEYMRSGRVAHYSYDPASGSLTGSVEGHNLQSYSSRVIFPQPKTQDCPPFVARCSCPVASNCKHAVALMLTAIDRADKARKALTAASSTWAAGGSKQLSTPQEDPAPINQQSLLPSWRRTLAHSLAARPDRGREPREQVSAALDLSFTVAGSYALGRRSGRKAELNLQARPLLLGAQDRWIKGGLSWESFQRDLQQGGSPESRRIYPEHAQWLTEFYSLVRPWQSAYTSHRDWVSLTKLDSALIWTSLAKAQELGLALLLDGQELGVGLAEAASIELELKPDPQLAGGLTLTPLVKTQQLSLPAYCCHRLGNKLGLLALGAAGQQAYQRAAGQARRQQLLPAALELASVEGEQGRQLSQLDLLFIPLAEGISPLVDSFLDQQEIKIPAEDTASFYQDFYPQLARNLPVYSGSPELELPPSQDPVLVLEISFDQQESQRAASRWYWDYPQDPLDPASERCQLDLTGQAGEQDGLRDAGYEEKILRRVRKVRPALDLKPAHYRGWQTQALLQKYLAGYRQLEGVRVDLLGPVPDFKEIKEKPVLEVTVASGQDRDWFDLGLVFKIGSWYLPFSQIFEALNANKSHVLLGDGSYFSLNQPEFLKLQELLYEASKLNNQQTKVRISPYQAGLWQEIEELASSTNASQAWKDRVGALLGKNQLPPAAVPASLQAELRPYQLGGFQWLYLLWQQELGGILADDMGLGKTVQVIALMAAVKAAYPPEEHHPFLILAPTSVLPNWEAEIRRFAPDLTVKTIKQSQEKAGQDLAHMISGADLVLSSYTLFRLDSQAYRALGQLRRWEGLILDEAQFVKNAQTKAYRAARDLPARFKLAVTGTPMENKLLELWTLFSIVAPGLFPSARAFKDHYAGPIESGEDPQALPRLRQRIRPLMLRRTKDLVARELPAKNDMRVNIPLDPAHRQAYDTLLQQERKKVLGLMQDMDKNRFTVFQSLTNLRRMALDASLIDQDRYGQLASAKIDYLQDKLAELLADGHKALVFSQFTTYLKKIAQRLDQLKINYLYLDGSTRDRASVLQSFKDGEAAVFLISLKAGGFGLNLTEADYCFIMDPWWNPAAEEQAVDRLHRIGQQRQVMVYRLVSAGTIEEKVMNLKESKAALFEAVIEQEKFFSSQLSSQEIQQLLADSAAF